MARSFVLLHGYQGSGEGHWQPWLADRLRAAGERVLFPDLPAPDAPVLDDWRAELTKLLVGLDGERVVVCHSLACTLWLHHCATNPGADLRVDRVLLVAPPSRAGVDGIAALERWFPAALHPGPVHAAARLGTRLVCGDDDPYHPEGAATTFAPLALATDVLPGAGHVNPDAGFGPWPAAEAWCLGAAPGLAELEASAPASAGGSGMKNAAEA